MPAVKRVLGSLPGFPGDRYYLAVLAGDTHISRWVEEARRLDHDQRTLTRVEALLTPESVVYDVGAYIGDHTAFYASRARRVLAFEAASDAFMCLCENTHRYPNVARLHVAVGDGSRCAWGAGFQEANCGARHLRRGQTWEPGVWTTRLDDFLIMKEYGPPTLIKMDIEGWEVAALQGAVKTLHVYHPTLVLEVNRGALERAGTSPAELYETVWLAGYRDLTDLFTGEGWAVSDARPQFDVVCR